jgi:thioredoxin 1
MAVQQIVSDADVNAVIKQSKTSLCIIDFFTDWCQPCQRIAPAYLELSKKYSAISFYKLNGESDVANHFDRHVKGYPTFLFIKNGEVIDKFVGADSASLERMINKHQ